MRCLVTVTVLRVLIPFRVVSLTVVRLVFAAIFILSFMFQTLT